MLAIVLLKEAYTRSPHKQTALMNHNPSALRGTLPYASLKSAVFYWEALINYQLTVHFDPRCAEAGELVASPGLGAGNAWATWGPG